MAVIAAPDHHQPPGQRLEVGKVDDPAPVSGNVRLSDSVQDQIVFQVLMKRFQHGGQVLEGDLSVAVLVDRRELFRELGDLLFALVVAMNGILI